MRSVSVVMNVFTEERWPSIVPALNSLRTQSHLPSEVIVVVDRNDSLKHRLETAFPDLRVVVNTHQRGLSGGRNTGIQCSRGDIVAFLDDDARAHDGWLAALLTAYADESVVGVGGPVLPEWDGVQRPSWFPEEFLWVVGCSYTGLPVRTGEVRNLIGTNMSFRRTTLDRVGLFSSTIEGPNAAKTSTFGCEETELCIRIRSELPDAKILYEPDAVVYHRIQVSRASWQYFRKRCHAEGRSKVLVSESVGAGAALSEERRYTTRILPRAAYRELGRFVRGPSRAPLARMAALAVGLSWAVAGYVRERAVRTTGRWLGKITGA